MMYYSIGNVDILKLRTNKVEIGSDLTLCDLNYITNQVKICDLKSLTKDEI